VRSQGRTKKARAFEVSRCRSPESGRTGHPSAALERREPPDAPGDPPWARFLSVSNSPEISPPRAGAAVSRAKADAQATA
jgi:hypothetical protein